MHMEEYSRDSNDLLSFSCIFAQQGNVEIELHRTQETFLSCIRCRSSFTILFPARFSFDFFSHLPGITTRRGKVPQPFRSARFASFRPARANLYKLCRRRRRCKMLCKVMISQGKHMNTSYNFFEIQRDICILYGGSNVIYVTMYIRAYDYVRQIRNNLPNGFYS